MIFLLVVKFIYNLKAVSHSSVQTHLLYFSNDLYSGATWVATCGIIKQSKRSKLCDVFWYWCFLQHVPCVWLGGLHWQIRWPRYSSCSWRFYTSLFVNVFHSNLQLHCVPAQWGWLLVGYPSKDTVYYSLEDNWCL